METAAQKPDDAPVDAGPVAPAPADQSIDDLLAEFDDKVGQQTESTTDSAVGDVLRSSEDQRRITDLSGQVDSFRAAEFQRQEREAASKWAAELQEVVSSSNPNVESDFVVRELKVLSADNPGLLEQAWQYRGLTDAQLAIAQKDLASAEKLYQRVLAEPDSEQKRNALLYLQQQGAQLQAMLGPRSVIRSAQNTIRKRAESVKAAYDPDVSATRAEIEHLMKEGGSGRAPPPEPQVQLGKLSDKEYRDHLMEKYGIAGF
jgi:hypothetical protein